MQEVQGKYCIPSQLLYSLFLQPLQYRRAPYGGSYERWNLQFKQIYQKIANKNLMISLLFGD